MNTKTLPLSLKRPAQSDTKGTIISLSGAWTIMETLISTVLTLFVAIIFVWVNGRQKEFNELENRSS
jgi:biopolymer transport protein ExbB/TolQ